jgi:hypothetical protein
LWVSRAGRGTGAAAQAGEEGEEAAADTAEPAAEPRKTKAVLSYRLNPLCFIRNPYERQQVTVQNDITVLV